MIVAEFMVNSSVLSGTLHQVPDSVIQWKETYVYPDGSTQMLVWITSDDFEAVQTAIEDDPSVRNPTVLADQGERRLYRMDLTGFGRVTDLVSEFIRVGGVLGEVIGTNGGWWHRARFPDRAAYQRIYRFCRDHELGFTFRRLVESTAKGLGKGGELILSLLTEEQREALMLAWEGGYFDIPRRTTLAGLAEELGLSDTAVSQRFHRAHSATCAYLFDAGGESHRPTSDRETASGASRPSGDETR